MDGIQTGSAASIPISNGFFPVILEKYLTNCPLSIKCRLDRPWESSTFAGASDRGKEIARPLSRLHVS